MAATALRLGDGFDVRDDDTLDAAIEKARDDVGRLAGYAGDGGEVVSFGGDAGGLDIALIEAAVFTIEIDEIEAREPSNSMRLGAANVRWTPRMIAPEAAACLTALRIATDVSCPS